jgi:hypothetical protein
MGYSGLNQLALIRLLFAVVLACHYVIDPEIPSLWHEGADVGIALVHAFCDREEIGMPAAAISAVQALTDFVQTCYGVPAIQTRILISCLLPTRYPPVWMLIQSERNRFLNDFGVCFHPFEFLRPYRHGALSLRAAAVSQQMDHGGPGGA